MTPIMTPEQHDAMDRWQKHQNRPDLASSPYWSGTFEQSPDKHTLLMNDLRILADLAVTLSAEAERLKKDT